MDPAKKTITVYRAAVPPRILTEQDNVDCRGHHSWIRTSAFQAVRRLIAAFLWH
ncbi:MAG: hypothetical protein HY000_02835 [Planctomycetes bacterium]|nr:hypothetical protein [Planctomycetota bacterium]